MNGLWLIIASLVAVFVLTTILIYAGTRYDVGYQDGLDMGRSGPLSLRVQLQQSQTLATKAWARSYVWYQEIIKLNKALRRYRRRDVRWKREHRETRKQVQTQAPLKALEQGSATKAGAEQGLQIRPTARPEQSPQKGMEG